MHYSRILEYIALSVNGQNGFTKFIFINKNNLLLIQFKKNIGFQGIIKLHS